MSTATVDRPMAERKPKDMAVKIDADVAHKAKIVAAFENKSLAEYLSDLLRPLVDQALDRHTRRVQEERSQ